jgi:hypothetical protein
VQLIADALVVVYITPTVGDPATDSVDEQHRSESEHR